MLSTIREATVGRFCSCRIFGVVGVVFLLCREVFFEVVVVVVKLL